MPSFFIPMAKPRHYSPQLSRFLVSVLYHEARYRRVPMTRLADQLLQSALQDTPGWTQAVNLGTANEPTNNRTQAA